MTIQNDEGFDWSGVFDGATTCFSKVEEDCVEEDSSEYESETSDGTEESSEVTEVVGVPTKVDDEVTKVLSEADEVAEVEVEENSSVDSKVSHMHHAFMAKVTEVDYDTSDTCSLACNICVELEENIV